MVLVLLSKCFMGIGPKWGKPLLLLFTMLLFCCSAQGGIILSTSVNAKLGGVSFGEGDLVEYDMASDTATLFFDGSALFSGEDIDAVHVLPNGNIVLSTETGATLGGLIFEDGDLVEYNPVANTAELYFDEDLFAGNEDIDAKSLMPSGNIVLSTSLSANLGGVIFECGDLVEYDMASDTATLIFDGSVLFDNVANIDAVHVLPNGNIILSTDNDATLGGLSFTDGDLVEYNGYTATLFFDGEARFGELRDIDAVYVPEPSTICLLGLGTLALLRKRRA